MDEKTLRELISDHESVFISRARYDELIRTETMWNILKELYAANGKAGEIIGNAIIRKDD